MLYLLLAFSFLNVSFASLDRISLDNLNLEYQKPYGRGEVDQINIDLSSISNSNHPLEVFKGENSFKVVLPFLNFSWINPWSFVYDLENVTAKKTSVSLGKTNHFVTAENLLVTPANSGLFKFDGVSLKCSGYSTQPNLDRRLFEDCLKKLDLSVEHLDVPVDFFLARIVEEFSAAPIPEKIRPADNLTLNLQDGNFSFLVYTKVIFYAGLRAWGNIHFQNDDKTMIIRIDEIKFGYLPITKIVLKELAKRVKHPDVIISGNYIVINLKK